MFCALHYVGATGLAGFMHLPLFPEQALFINQVRGTTNLKGVPVDRMANCICMAIKTTVTVKALIGTIKFYVGQTHKHLRKTMSLVNPVLALLDKSKLRPGLRPIKCHG